MAEREQQLQAVIEAAIKLLDEGAARWLVRNKLIGALATDEAEYADDGYVELPDSPDPRNARYL